MPTPLDAYLAPGATGFGEAAYDRMIKEGNLTPLDIAYYARRGGYTLGDKAETRLYRDLQTWKGYKGQVDVLGKQYSGLQSQYDSLKGQSSGYESQIKDWQNQASNYQSQLGSLQNQYSGLQGQLSDSKNQATRYQLEADNYRSKASQFESDLFTANQRIGSYERDIADYQKRYQGLESEFGNYKNQFETAKADYQKTLNQKTTDYDLLNSNYALAQAEKERLNLDLARYKEEAISAQISSLRGGDNRGQGPGGIDAGGLAGGGAVLRAGGNRAPLVDVRRELKAGDSVLNRRGPVVEVMQGGESGGSGGSGGAPRAMASGGGGAGQYYGRRFG